MDEHAWRRANGQQRTRLATGIVDLSPGRSPRLLDVLDGRSGRVYGDWIAEREQTWRDQVRFTALDPFRGYATALRGQLPGVVRVLDAFHVVRLGFQAVDEVRRRVQQATTGHRGHQHDPLYAVRRLLRRGAERLTPLGRARLQAALDAGDPDGELALTWHCAQQLRAVYRAKTAAEGRRRVRQLLELLAGCPIPEIARLHRTLLAWRRELLAYLDTDGASNGPTEAINLVIEKIRRAGHGFRNFDNYRLRLPLVAGVDRHTPETPRIRARRPRMVA